MNSTMSDLFNMVITKLTKDGVDVIAEKIGNLTEDPFITDLPAHVERCPILFPLGVIKGRKDLGPVGLRLSIRFGVEPLKAKEVTDE